MLLCPEGNNNLEGKITLSTMSNYLFQGKYIALREKLLFKLTRSICLKGYR